MEMVLALGLTMGGILVPAHSQAPPPETDFDPSMPYHSAGAVARIECAPYWHEEPVVSAILTPDEKTLVCLDSAGNVIGWNRESVRRLYRRQLIDSGWQGRRLVSSPRGTWVVLSSNNPRLIVVFETRSGDEVLRIERCAGVALTPDERNLAAWSGRNIRCWDVRTGTEPWLSIRSDVSIVDGAFSPDGRLFAATVENSSGPVLWDTRTGRRILEPSGSVHNPQATGLAFSPDGRTLAVGTFWDVGLWELGDRGAFQTRSIEAFGGPPLRFTPDGKHLIGSHRPKRIGVWEVHNGECLGTWSVPSTLSGFIALSDRGSILIEGLGTGVRLADSARELDHGVITGAGWSSEHRAIHCDSMGKAGVWCLDRGEKMETHQLGMVVRALSADGKRAAAVDADGLSIRLIEVADGKVLLKVQAPGRIASLALSPDGSIVAAGTEWSFLSLWRVPDRKAFSSLTIGSTAVTHIAWSADGKVLVAADESGGMVFIRSESGGEQMRFKPKGHAFHALALAPDGTAAASGEAEGRIRLWDPIPGREPRLLGQKEDDVTSLSFSPDGGRIAAGYKSGAVLLWRLGSEDEPIELGRHYHAVSFLSFSPEGRLLISGGFAPAAAVWSVPASR